MNEVISPCISVCKLDPVSGYCEGCWRTRDEIALWRRMDNPERLEVIKRLHERRAEAGLETRGRRRNRRSA